MVARCLPVFKVSVSLIMPPPFLHRLTCFIFLSSHPAYTHLFPVPLPLSLFLDSLSSSCISCGVYVQFGSDWNHIGKTACHLNEVTVIQMGGWVVRRGIIGEAVLACKGLGDTANPPSLPFSTQQTAASL